MNVYPQGFTHFQFGNEWLVGPVSRTLKSHFEHADIRRHLKRSTTYPGVLPLFNLDHIFFTLRFKLERLRLKDALHPSTLH
jgi:hypothetical protein